MILTIAAVVVAFVAGGYFLPKVSALVTKEVTAVETKVATEEKAVSAVVADVKKV